MKTTNLPPKEIDDLIQDKDPGPELLRKIKKEIRYLNHNARGQHTWPFAELNEFLSKLESHRDEVKSVFDNESEQLSNVIVWDSLCDIITTLEGIIYNPEDDKDDFEIVFSEGELSPVLTILQLDDLGEEYEEFTEEAATEEFSNLIKDINETNNKVVTKVDALKLIDRIDGFMSNIQEADLSSEFKGNKAVLKRTKKVLEEHIEGLSGLGAIFGSDEFKLSEDLADEIDDFVED